MSVASQDSAILLVIADPAQPKENTETIEPRFAAAFAAQQPPTLPEQSTTNEKKPIYNNTQLGAGGVGGTFWLGAGRY